MRTFLRRYLDQAAKAWAKATLNIKRFADAYAGAVTEFDEEAREAFAAAYPMFGPREWKRLMLIAEGKLLPHFMFKSDSFVCKLLKMNVNWQKALVSMNGDGKLRVDRGRGPELVSLNELTRSEEKALAMLLNETDEKLSQCDIVHKFRNMVICVNKNHNVSKNTWRIVEANGRVVAKFVRNCTMDKGDLKAAISALDLYRKGRGGKNHGRSCHDILMDLVKAVQKLEAARDKESDMRMDGKVLKLREKVNTLAKEATGDNGFEI